MTYSLRLRSCKIDGRLCHLVLAFLMLETLQMAGAPWLHGHYSASLLLRTRPPPSRLQPPSRCCRLYDLPCSDDFSPGRGRLLQFLGVSLSPCCRFHPAEMNSRVGQCSTVHAAFALRLRARPSDLLTFEATTRSLLLRPGDSLISPREILSMGFRILVSLHPAIQTTGLLTLAPAGLFPAEHTSLYWTHNRA